MEALTLESQTTTEGRITAQLREATAAISKEKFSQALDLVRAAKTADARNIYLIATERQVQRLLDFAQRGLLNGDHKRELVDLIRQLLDRALRAEREKPSSSGHDPDKGNGQTPAAVDLAKNAALMNVKQRFLNCARDFEQNGDIERALGETRRVLSIDPEDEAAKEYEQHLLRVQSISLSTMAAAEESDVIQTAAAETVPHDQIPAVESQVPPQQITLPLSTPDLAFEPMDGSAAGPEPTELPEPVDKSPAGPEPTEFAEPLDKTPAGPEPTELVEPAKEARPKPAAFLIAAGGASVVAALIFIGVYMSTRGAQSEAATSPALSTSSQTGQPGQEISTTQATGDLAAKAHEAVQTKNRSGRSERDRKKTESESSRSMGDEGSTNAAESSSASVEPVVRSEQSQGEALSPSGSAGMASSLLPETLQPRTNTRASSKESSTSPTVTTLVKEAQLTQLSRPDYPRIAWENRQQGKVTVRVLVDPTGKAVRAEVTASSNPLFDEAAIEAALKSAYSPRVTSQGPAQAWVVIPLNFRL